MFSRMTIIVSALSFTFSSLALASSSFNIPAISCTAVAVDGAGPLDINVMVEGTGDDTLKYDGLPKSAAAMELTVGGYPVVPVAAIGALTLSDGKANFVANLANQQISITLVGGKWSVSLAYIYSGKKYIVHNGPATCSISQEGTQGI